MSWKKYGGIEHFDTQNNIRSHSITTENFTLLGVVYGVFTISGLLHVTENTILDGNLNVGGNSFFNSNVFVNENTTVSGVTTFLNDVSMQSTLTVYKELYLDSNRDHYFYGTPVGVGLNTTTPDAALTISSEHISALNLYSNTPVSRNIFSHNTNGIGIALVADASSSYIEFFQTLSGGLTVANSNIRSTVSGGYLQINDSNQFQVFASTSISPSVYLHDPNSGKMQMVNKETLVVYDTFDSSYLWTNYEAAAVTKGNAISAISQDNSSNAFINLSAPNRLGGAIGGGVAPYDISKSMLTAGITNLSGDYLPHNVITSGVLPNRLRVNMGVNTYMPSTQYTMDINGPVNMKDGECYMSNLFPNFNVNRAVFYRGNRNYGYACCKNIHVSNNGHDNYQFPVLTTKDTSGLVWNVKYITNTSITGNNLNDGVDIDFLSLYVYSPSIAILAGTRGFIFYTSDYGDTWNQIVGTGINLTSSQYIYSLYAASYPILQTPPKARVFASLVDASYQNVYFDITLVPTSLNGSTGVVGSTSFFIPSAGESCPSSFDGSGNSSYFWYTFNNQIIYSAVSTPLTISRTFNTGFQNNFVDIFVVSDQFVVAATKNDIYNVVNGVTGSAYTNSWGANTNFRYIDCFDSSNVIIYDVSYQPLYTSNYPFSWNYTKSIWNYIDYDTTNSNGMSHVVFKKHPLISVIIYDLNTIVVIHKNDGGKGCTFYYCYLPAIFNYYNNTVLNMVGNTTQYGNIYQTGIIHQW